MFRKIGAFSTIRAVKWLARAGLDWLYPPRCVGCENAARCAICEECARDLVLLRDPFCERCSEPFAGEIEGAFSCPHCASLRFHFSWARALLLRNEMSLRVVHALKYERRRDVMEALRLRMRDLSLDERVQRVFEESWVLVPVPLFSSKWRERYYNQAAELARIWAQEFGIRVESNWVKRVRNTGTQTRLSRAQRQRNVAGAFALTNRGKLALAEREKRPAGIIIVDDVFTTGATVNACAAAFRAGGMENIVVVTLLRG